MTKTRLVKPAPTTPLPASTASTRGPAPTSPARPDRARDERPSIPSQAQQAFLMVAKATGRSVALRLLDGSSVEGRIVAFDTFTIRLAANHGELLVYKQAIITIT